MALSEAGSPSQRTDNGASNRVLPPFAALLACAALVCAAPGLAVVLGAGHSLTLGHAVMADPLVGEAALGTLVLVLLGATVSTGLGAIAAFVVHSFDFPGRQILAWALVLPLAAPAYVLAYAYGGLTGPLGPLPLGLSGAPAAACVYVLAFYPYGYLAVRAALAAQSVCALEAARTLGASPWRTVWRITTPLAWPAIAAGAALSAMEIAADYGAAAYFGVITLSTGVFRAWFAHANPELALQIAAVLLIAAASLLAIERATRGRRLFAGGSIRWRDAARVPLTGWAALTATGFCAALVGLAFVLPTAWLVRLALYAPEGQASALFTPAFNSLALASAACLLTLALASLIALGARTRLGALAGAAASAGYAAPGAVMALGGLMAMGTAREYGWIGGVGAGGALIMLLWIYAARFAAAGIGPIDAGLQAVTPHHVAAARVLGAGRLARWLRVEAPMAAPGIVAAALIVFVEVLKELPATLILRPFNFDTLAVVAHGYAADDRLNAAAPPALMILAAGAIPVVLLTKGLAKARAGTR